MAKIIDFRKVKKQFLTVTLADAEYSENKKDTVLMIGTPTKAIMDDLISLQNSLEDINEGEANEEATDELYLACSKLMSRNKGGVHISKDYLEKIFDFEDIMIFFTAYMEFIDTVTSAKN